MLFRLFDIFRYYIDPNFCRCSANFRRTVVFAWRRLLCPKWQPTKEECATNTHARSCSKTTNGTASFAHQLSTRRLLPASSSSRRQQHHTQLAFAADAGASFRSVSVAARPAEPASAAGSGTRRNCSMLNIVHKWLAATSRA